jgi:hypothetical protein
VGVVSESNRAIGSFPPTVYKAVPSRGRAVTIMIVCTSNFAAAIEPRKLGRSRNLNGKTTLVSPMKKTVTSLRFLEMEDSRYLPTLVQISTMKIRLGGINKVWLQGLDLLSMRESAFNHD